MARILITFVVLLISVTFVDASDTLPGPVPAQVIRVIDGDTIVVKAQIWTNTYVEESVRLRGIDAPELRGRCEIEREKAAVAKNVLEKATLGGVMLWEIGREKYGRLLARVEVGGQDVGETLLEAGLAHSYKGGKRERWCGD